jgi:hypothetical protein
VGVVKKVFRPLLMAAVVVVSVVGVVLALHAHAASTPGASHVAPATRTTGVPQGALEALKRLATDPQSVAVDQAALLEGPGGYIQGIPRGSRIEVKAADRFVTGGTSVSFLLTSIPPGEKPRQLAVDLEMRDGLWKVTSVAVALVADDNSTN